MAISATTIIHYTKQYETLEKIISEKGFKFTYCIEKVNTRGGKSYSFAIAMISFCDIPLTDYKKHFLHQKNKNNLGYYGDYGIGLSKDWATREGLNPVLYIDYNSHVGTTLRHAAERLLVKGRNEDLDQFPFYAKNYQGPLFKDNVREDKYRFYDEREWRLVPKRDYLKNSIVLKSDVYSENRDYWNRQISEPRLGFTASDISYIIVKDESEILNLSNLLRKTFTHEEADLLLTKVLTSVQIMNDF